MATVITGTVAQVSVRGVALTKGGERQEYMNLGSDDLSYQLECLVDARPVDIVNITWSLNTLADVYTWVASTGLVTVKEPLKDHVRSASEGVVVGPDIQFTSPTPSMRGLYACNVYHNRNDVSDNPVKGFFDLQMYAFFQEGYNISASLEGCAIRWNFSTPRIYPRPSVRCGFWSTATGEEVSLLSGGGLVYRQDIDHTWHVFVQDSLLQVRDVPRGTTLQCNTQVPIANYSRQTGLSQNPVISSEVEDRGCPALPPLKANMDVRVRGCWYNCRDECHQIGGGGGGGSWSSSPAEAEYRCDPGYVAKWGLDDRPMPEWRLKVTCDETRHSWLSPDGSPAMALRLPTCLYSGATDGSPSIPLFVLTPLVVWLPWTRLAP
ncbi:uncharacterized protein [Panulirus ornatus]